MRSRLEKGGATYEYENEPTPTETVSVSPHQDAVSKIHAGKR